MKEIQFQSILKNVYIGLLLLIFGGIVLHAPLSVGLGVIWPDYDLIIKSWKEILMIIAGLVVMLLLIVNHQLNLLKQPIIILSAVYAGLCLILVIFINGSLNSKLAGLIIDLRYIFFFCLVYLALKMWPKYQKMFLKVGLVGALVVVVFGLLQIFILPKDILKYIGYSNDTISPFMTVDENSDFIRINSTMRGPNPLGAYLVIVLSVALGYFVGIKNKLYKKYRYLFLFLIFGGLITLWFSYSRSAIIAAVVSILVILGVAFWKNILSKKIIVVTVGVFLLVLSGLVILFNNNYLISNVLLHQNPNDGSVINSNDGHLVSIKNGLSLALAQPLGAGIGSSGSASILGDNPLIIENQYLFITHEAGWLGLLLFMLIFGLVMRKLWQGRKDWLALGAFASGIGLALIGLLLPVWADDIVSIIWWGLAAIVLANQK